MEQNAREKRSRWLRDLLCGALIGAGAILPGVSGGVLAVVFDVYRPVMETLTHPVRGLRKYWPIFLPLGIGSMVGFRSGVCPIGRRNGVAVYRPDRGDVPGSVAGSGEGGPQSRRVGELRCLCAGGVHDPILYSAHPPCDGDAEFLVV